MKRYISAALVNALLLQLVGCYSQKSITYNEFYNLQNVDEAVICTNAEKSIKLTTDSLKNNYVQWNAAEDSIIIWSKQTVHEKNHSIVVSDTIKLTSSEIDKVIIDEYDGTKTFIAIAIPIAVLALIAYAVSSSISLNFKGILGGGTPF